MPEGRRWGLEALQWTHSTGRSELILLTLLGSPALPPRSRTYLG